ncbi:hypothetical protein [Pseudomonas sp. NR3]|uniref:hypothetical protein n=1 Tax=Pseudomonas sp. NR3 TaxID=3155978 RepID=UPI003B67B6E5
MGALKNSRYIYLWGPAWRRQGWIGGVVLIVKIAGLVVFPRAYIIKGDVHPGDIADFPPRLKRLLIIKVAMTLIVVVWMVIAAVLIQFK